MAYSSGGQTGPVGGALLLIVVTAVVFLLRGGRPTFGYRRRAYDEEWTLGPQGKCGLDGNNQRVVSPAERLFIDALVDSSKVNPDAPPTGQIKCKDPRMALEMCFDKYRSFLCGYFPGTLTRSMKSQNADIGLAAFTVVTMFSVTVADVDKMRIKIRLVPNKWEETMAMEDDADFLSALDWDMEEMELYNTFRKKKENVARLRKLFAMGPGEISCEGEDFFVSNWGKISRAEELEAFWQASRDIFWAYAQIVQFNLPSWRLPENNYDWWKEGES